MSIDTRTLAAGDLYVAIRGERFDGADFAAAAIAAGAAGVVVPRGWTRARMRGASAAAARAERRSSSRSTTRPSALQALAHGDPARVGHESRGHHRQRRQDHDEGSDGGVSRGAVPRGPQPRELQQPHRAAAVAHRAEAAAGDRRRRAGHESRRGNQHAGARRRAGRPGVDERRRGASAQGTEGPARQGSRDDGRRIARDVRGAGCRGPLCKRHPRGRAHAGAADQGGVSTPAT